VPAVVAPGLHRPGVIRWADGTRTLPARRRPDGPHGGAHGRRPPPKPGRHRTDPALPGVPWPCGRRAPGARRGPAVPGRARVRAHPTAPHPPKRARTMPLPPPLGRRRPPYASRPPTRSDRGPRRPNRRARRSHRRCAPHRTRRADRRGIPRAPRHRTAGPVTPQHSDPPHTSDVIVVGGGAAGLSLAHRITATGPMSVTVVEPPDGPARPPERTWCYWDRDTGDLDAAVTAAWPRLRVHGADGRPVTVDPAPLRYRMLRSGAFERLVHQRLAASPGGQVLRATADTVHDVPGGAE